MNAHARFEGDGGAPAHGDAHDQIFIPKPIMGMMIALALFTIVSIGVARATGAGLTRESAHVAATSIVFRTGEVAEGPIVATLVDGRRIAIAGDHEDIFPRMILTGITTIRRDVNIPVDAPLAFEVTPDGQRLIVDAAAGHVIRLSAFGPENGHSFDALLAGARG